MKWLFQAGLGLIDFQALGLIFGFLVFEAAWLIPFIIVFRNARLKTSYAALSLVPIAGPWICIWILASKPWHRSNRGW